MKCSIMILIGAPAVGKTTFARSLSDTNQNGLKFLHVEHDKLMPVRDLAQAPANQWKKDRSGVLKKIERFLEEAGDLSTACFDGVPLNLAHNDGLVIVVDDNMYYKSMRQVYYRLAQTHNCGFCQVYFKIGIELALAGNSQRSGRERVPEHVIRNIYAKIEEPSSLNSWEKNTMVILRGDFETSMEELFGLVKHCLESPESVTEVEEKVLPSTSVCHELDIKLRKLISVKISEARVKMSKNELAVFSKTLGTVKGSILQDFKNGLFHCDASMSLEVFANEVFSHKLTFFSSHS